MSPAPRAAALALVLLALAACSVGEEDEGGGTLPQAPTSTDAGPPGETGAPETDDGGDDEEALRPPARGRRLRLETVASGLEAPIHAAAAPGEAGRLYVVEQAGRIRVVDDGRVRPEPFLDITGQVASGGERGLLSVAFHPRYARNGRFYVDYTDGDGDTRVVEYRAGAGSPPRARRTLLAVDQPYANHNGGQLAFGPDGLLYTGTGDGGSGGDPENRAQDLSSPLGKLLRLDVDERGAEWETVGYGLRNPWRFSFDRATGDLWIGDVGQNAVEEIDFVPARRVGELLNFGWDVFEGSSRFEDKEPSGRGRLVGPIAEYGHNLGCSVTGGFVYRGEAVRRAWGRYFYGDYCSGRVWSLAREGGRAVTRGHPFAVPALASFAEGLDGELYLVSQQGTVHRLAER